jgi:hypothetical protein
MPIQGLILNPESKQAAYLLAEKTFNRYRNNPGHYRNTVSSHLVGHLGEFAAFIWLRDNGFEPVAAFSDLTKDKEADILTNVGRVEVKTWSERYWEKWGRCVSVSQYASIKRKADYIFWLSVDEVESETPKVQFRGWCEVDIFEGMAPIMTGDAGREVRNYQLDSSQLNPVEEMGKLHESRGNTDDSDQPDNGRSE